MLVGDRNPSPQPVYFNEQVKIMGYIYRITNKINGKQYIGATSRTIQQRWVEHQSDVRNKWDKIKHRPFYQDLKKYGADSFIIEEIKQCQNEDLEKLECYYIEKYKTNKDGYNIAKGGSGKKLIEHESVIKKYNELGRVDEVAQSLHIDQGNASYILKSHGIKVKSSYQILTEVYGKRVQRYSLDNEYLDAFDSMRKAAKQIAIEQKKKMECIGGIAAHIIQVCNGERQTAYGYKWKHASNI